MRKIILCSTIIISFLACSQNKTEIMQNPNITANNIVQEISNQVRNYSSEKIYKIRFSKEECLFDVYIDDIPVFRNFNDNVPDAFEINNTIFKKGYHKVSYRVFPLGKVSGIDSVQNTLTDKTQLEFTVKSYDLKNEKADDIEYIKHSIPMIEEKITTDYSRYKFEGTGKAYYEGSFDINVDISYELHPPFENAQDLRKIDKKLLENKLLKEYNKIRTIYQNKEKDNIAKLIYDNLKDQLITDYSTREQVKAAWDEINEIMINSETEIFPIENYEMRFFSNGKLVALFTDGSNPKIRGGNALVCNVISGDHGKGLIELKHFFYIPQGETEFKVY